MKGTGERGFRRKQSERCNPAIRRLTASGRTAVVGVCLAGMPSRQGAHPCAQEVDHG